MDKRVDTECSPTRTGEQLDKQSHFPVHITIFGYKVDLCFKSFMQKQGEEQSSMPLAR